MSRARPIKGFVYLYDDQPEMDEGDVVVQWKFDSPYMDYVVVAGEGEGFGPGDRVVLKDPYAGRRAMLDGVVYRIVRAADVMAKMED